MGRIGIWELVLILIIVLIIFGAGRLPKIARSVGEGIKEFKKAIKEKEPQQKEKEEDKDENPS